MIQFRQKSFSEHDAMRSLYKEILNDKRAKYLVKICDLTKLIPILKGNNLVIERFVISDSLFGKDKYRMYLKVGAKAEMPDSVKLPGWVKSENIGKLLTEVKGLINYPKPKDNNNWNNNNNNNNNNGGGYQLRNNSDITTTSRVKLFSRFELKEFKGKGGGGGDPKFISAVLRPAEQFLSIDKLQHLGETLKYDKKERSLVLEFNSILDAIKSLEVLPFGLGFDNIYLLNRNQ